jgi:hypothetical protein
MKDRIKDIVATLGQLQSFVLDFAYMNSETIIVYVKCNVSISDEQFFVTCEWNGKKFNELLTYSEIEDTFKRMYNGQLNTYWIVVNRVIGIIKSKLNKQIQQKLIDKHEL